MLHLTNQDNMELSDGVLLMRRIIGRRNLLMASVIFLLALLCSHSIVHSASHSSDSRQVGQQEYLASNPVASSSISSNSIGTKVTLWHGYHAFHSKFNLQNSSDSACIPKSLAFICVQPLLISRQYISYPNKERRLWLLNRTILI